MNTKRQLTKRLLSLILCMALMLTGIPFSALAADGVTDDYYNRVADVNTMDNWQKYFDLNNLDTSNAGGVWTDKSVFTDASAFPSSVTMLDNEKNFLTALSALAANKEVVGYSTIPTDTVLVLDLSGSMENSNSESALITATNNAITELLKVNENNRVGVVLYSAAGTTGTSTYMESVTRILPIDRYTTGSDNVYLRLSNGSVSVDNDVEGTVANADLGNRKNFGGGTYIQAGLWGALEMFQEMDTVIGENNWQSDDNRMPILVLMSDGAPSTGTTYYDDVKNSQYTTQSGNNGGPGGPGGPGQNQNQTVTVYESNVGNGNENGLTAGNAFLTQLTASYVMNQIEAHYQQEDSNVRGLFYTLGFNIGNNDVAQSVMNPDASTFTDALWNTYNNLTTGNMSIRVKNRNGGTSDVTIAKNSYATSKSYVDEYFSASGTGLSTAFDSIVQEIILQSRYYPTHLKGGNPDFSGYVEFEDVLGKYMEVKHINGILLGDTLFDGHMMASKLTDTSVGGLGTVENPTALGDEFIRAVKTRLGITGAADAQALVANAFAAGQLKYNSATDWSNYIAWYAKADGTYAGFWDENSTAAAPDDAVYKIKSYGFLGETTGSIKNSDMMYMSVQVRTNISTGEQTLLWKIPAALVPMVTYLVTLEGTNVDEAQNVTVSVENADTVSPIRLIFESGLRSDLNELNITRITDSKHIADDGITRQFWTNYFDISAPTHDEHITTRSEFTPSKENERFYYTFASAVHKQVGDQYVLVQKSEGLDENGEYYHRRYVFKEGESKPVFLYEKMSAASIAAATWDATFETLTGDTGAYVVPDGTPARELQMYDEQKDDTDNIDTKSAHMVFHPYLTEQNDIVYVDMNLGNNGLLEITPAQGIKLSKTVDVYETGTSADFRFRITVHNADGTPYTGSLNSWITDLDVVPLEDAVKIDLSSTGTYTADLTMDQTIWLTGIPAGSTYTIEELDGNSDYKVKSVHVNGSSTGTVAYGTVAAYYIDDVRFINTALGEGDLVITKQVVDENGAPVDINDNVTFTAQVTLTDESGTPVSGHFEASNAAGYLDVPANGTFTVQLTEGESFVLRNIPEGTRYSVVETQIPNGFAFNAASSSLTGVVDATANDQALIVNTYVPTATSGSTITLDVAKAITGNRTEWVAGESYSFEVKHISTTRANGTVAQFTIDTNDADKKYRLDLSGERYDEAGTYHYSITEINGNIGGITYDTVERRFAVVVADADMDGDLEITAVNNEANTIVTKSDNAYTVTANFNNVYAPTGTAIAEIDIQKTFVSGNHSLSGYQFVLYDADPSVNANATEVVRSGLTDASGKAAITLAYAANFATMEGVTYTYYLAEVNAGRVINNIQYTDAVYKVQVTVKDNGDGTVSANTVVSGLPQGVTVPTFTNKYVPSASDFVTVSGRKTISTGNRVLNANEFIFELNAVTADAPMPANTTIMNAANGSFAFDTIEFGDAHKGNTYEYTVSEVRTNPIGGFVYDTTVYTISVDVRDNGDNTITAVMTIHDGTTNVQDIVFKNAYDPTDAEVVLTAEKLLTGKTLQDDEFAFILTPTGNTTLPNASYYTASNVGSHVTFNKLVYDKAGVYTYTVTERATNDARYDFDDSVYDVTVTVTDNSRGTLSANVEIVKNGVDGTAIVFRNGFVPTPIEFDIYDTFGGKKVLDGRPVEADEFEFVLMNAVTGVQIGETVKNDANGTFRFPTVTLPDAGEYHFRVSEVVGDEKGVTYDTTIYHVFVQVAKSANGTLSVADQKLRKGTVTKEEVGGVLTEVVHYEDVTGNIVFNNSYKADPAYVTLEATKTLTGRDLVDGEFKFDLHKTASDFAYDANTVLQDNIVLTLNRDGSGTITFMPMVFEEEGTYYYLILEDEADARGVTSDNTEYKVIVTVVDNHNGNLVATVKVNNELIVGSTVEAVKFHNTYSVAATEIVIKGQKTLTGRDLVADEFSFELYDKTDTKLETVKNAADGSFIFTAIPVTKEGTYVYTVRETQGNADGVTYDNAVYTVTVTVTDNLDGTFKVVYTYAVGADEAESMVFVNTYTPPAPVPEIPQTGENASAWMWFAVAFVSGCFLFGTAKLKKQKREEEN